ncbi:MAG: hypothetical protein GY822_23900 [Deltaproteobacteria bacterium]|nr:hypothetical protein [Deltaproteobacteria bacterium]
MNRGEIAEVLIEDLLGESRRNRGVPKKDRLVNRGEIAKVLLLGESRRNRRAPKKALFDEPR